MIKTYFKITALLILITFIPSQLCLGDVSVLRQGKLAVQAARQRMKPEENAPGRSALTAIFFKYLIFLSPITLFFVSSWTMPQHQNHFLVITLGIISISSISYLSYRFFFNDRILYAEKFMSNLFLLLWGLFAVFSCQYTNVLVRAINKVGSFADIYNYPKPLEIFIRSFPFIAIISTIWLVWTGALGKRAIKNYQTTLELKKLLVILKDFQPDESPVKTAP